MSEDELIDLQHLVNTHEEELNQQTKSVEALKKRVSVLENDVKTLVQLCHRLRVAGQISHERENPEGKRTMEKFSVEISPLIQRYMIKALD